MKKYLSGFLTGIIVTLTITTFAESSVVQALFTNDIKLKVNGNVSPAMFVNVNGTNYAKVRDIVSAIGGVTAWDNDTKTILVNTTSEPINTLKSIQPSSTIQSNNTNIDENKLKQTTYNGYKAFEYNNNIYISINDIKKLVNNCYWSLIQFAPNEKSKIQIQFNSDSIIIDPENSNELIKVNNRDIYYININVVSKFIQ